MSGNSTGGYPCLNNGPYSETDFPMNAVVTFTQPLNYTTVKTDQSTAEEYLKYLEKNKPDTSLGRPAYIRYRVKVDQYMGPVKIGSEQYANFFGELESVSVFGDKDLFIKLEDRKF